MLGAVARYTVAEARGISLLASCAGRTQKGQLATVLAKICMSRFRAAACFRVHRCRVGAPFVHHSIGAHKLRSIGIRAGYTQSPGQKGAVGSGRQKGGTKGVAMCTHRTQRIDTNWARQQLS